MNADSQLTRCHATLTEALYKVLECDVSFQQRVLQHITARMCCLGSTAGTDSDGRIPMAQTPPPWSYRDDYLSSPQGVYAARTPPSRADVGNAGTDVGSSSLPLPSVELLWKLNVYHVAQTAPSAAGALLNTPCAAVNASAAAALQFWLLRHHAPHQQQSRAVTDPAVGAAWATDGGDGDGGRNINRAVERAESDATPASWPPAWWAALESGEVACVVRVVLLRVPSAYGTFHAASVAPAAEGSPGAERGLRVDGAAPFSYPSDAFLEAAPVLHVIGVVHRVFYESRSTSSPAPWLTLLPLLPNVAAPPYVTVDLTSLSRATVDAVAVLGTVVELRGYTRVAQRPTRAGRSAGRREGEATLAEYVVASWAAVVSASDAARGEDSAEASFPSVSRTCQSSPNRVDATQQHQWCGETLRDVLDSDRFLEEGLSAWEEDAAARAALCSWAGTRLALGARGGDGHETAWPTTLLFSVSPDVVIAAQLALLSAQLSDGVVVLLADDAPESFLSQMMHALRTTAPTAAVEVSSELLCRAAPSTFLPSYRVQSVPATALPPPPPPPSHVPPVSAGNVKSVASGLQGLPRFTTPRHRGRVRGVSAAAAAPPPPPCFAEALCGGVLSRAGGRALVLQGLELMPPPTLAVLREAWRPRGVAEGEAEAAVEKWGGRQSSNNKDSEDVVSIRSGGVLQLERGTSTPLRGVPPSLVDGGRHVIQREGGQRVRYRVAHAALCSVRQPSRLTEMSHLFEFAQRCDVVLRPAYDRGRQAAAAVHAGVTAPFQRLLQSRRASWLQLLGQTFALPAAREEEKGAVMESKDVAPTLTEACSRLLSTYFIAAKAVCEAGTDASMMATLVKLTITHARWRLRLTHLRQQQEMCSGEPSDAIPVTALVDAVVAVGLCDATLHFFTATTLLGDCVLRLLEREAWASWEGDKAAAEAVGQTAEMALGEGEEAELYTSVPPDVLPEVRELYAQVEFRTRVGVKSHADQRDGAPPQPSSSFSMGQLVGDLVGHLERMSHPIAPSMAA